MSVFQASSAGAVRRWELSCPMGRTRSSTTTAARCPLTWPRATPACASTWSTFLPISMVGRLIHEVAAPLLLPSFAGACPMRQSSTTLHWIRDVLPQLPPRRRRLSAPQQPPRQQQGRRMRKRRISSSSSRRASRYPPSSGFPTGPASLSFIVSWKIWPKRLAITRPTYGRDATLSRWKSPTSCGLVTAGTWTGGTWRSGTTSARRRTLWSSSEWTSLWEKFSTPNMWPCPGIST